MTRTINLANCLDRADESSAPVPVVYGRGSMARVDAERNLVGILVERFGTWAVTTFGVECLAAPYQIMAARLDGQWLSHMNEKRWVVHKDFASALEAGRIYHRATIAIAALKSRPPVGKRFVVLKRDGYRCQLCGRGAIDGVKLEVDHKIPRARGGGDHIDNRWTLCWDCNRGKSAGDL